MERARAAAADFTGGEPEGIAFGANMTTLNFQLAHAVARTLEPGDEIVVTELDHDANVSPWLVVAADHDLVVRTAPLRAEDVTLDLDALEELIGERTRVVAFTLASNAVGSIPDAARIAAAAHARRRPRVGRRRAPRAAPPPARGRARARRGALLAVQVLRPAPRDRGDPARPGRVAAGRPRAARRRGPARPSLRGRHPVARGDRGRAGGDRVPPRARRRRPRRRPSRRSRSTRRSSRRASSAGCRTGSSSTASGPRRAARPPSASTWTAGRPARWPSCSASASSTSGTATTTRSSRCARSVSPTRRRRPRRLPALHDRGRGGPPARGARRAV